MATHNINIRPGVTETLVLQWFDIDPDTKVKTPIDISGYFGKMQIRDEPNGNVLLEISTTASASGTMTLTNQGVVNIVIPSGITSVYTQERAFYDVLLVSPSGEVIDFVEGTVTRKSGITQL